MGHLQHKYTRTYFTKTNPDGSTAGYGVEGYDEFMEGRIRDIDLSILDRINFAGRRVLEFGFGRGEAIKYALEHGAALYEGVDFAEHAIAIASEFLQRHKLAMPPLHHADALSFLNKYVPIHNAEKRSPFDIVLMLDFVEHVPRTELLEIMTLLRGILSDTAVVAINTPAFRVDNDVIRDGLSPLNSVELIDTSDLIEETAGMHCNKYTIVSLQEFMCSCGFMAISGAHFYIPVQTADQNMRAMPAFRQAWEKAVTDGHPLSPDWKEDLVEYAYHRQEIPDWHTFNEGRLDGISLLIAGSYQHVFSKGEYDSELFEDIGNLSIAGKTVFDVGGFMGVSALLFARQVGSAGRVLCFEPNPWNQQRIRSNFSRNQELAKRISLYGLALGNVTGNMEMLLSDNVDNGHSSTSQSVISHGTLPKDQLLSLGFYNKRVSISTLDDFVRGTGLIPDVLKVDIEGAEHLFLDGAEATLRNHRPEIYMEVHSPYCAWFCSLKLQRLGYYSWLLNEEYDGRIMIKAVPLEISIELRDCPSLNNELCDMLRVEQQRLINSEQILNDTKKEFENFQRDFARAMKIVNHPLVKIQLNFGRILKKIF